MKNFFESKADIFDKIATIAFFMVLIAEFFVIIFVNLTQNQNHVGYDSSAIMLKAMEMWKQKSLFPLYYEQTTLQIDAGVLLSSILYGLTKNIFLSFGIVNIVISFAICLIAYKIIHDFLDVPKLYIFMVISILLCNFMTEYSTINPLNYAYPALYTSSAFYGLKMFGVLLCLHVALLFTLKKHVNLIYIGITILFCMLSGISSGYWALMIVVLPIIITMFIQMLMYKDIKRLLNRTLYFLLVCSIVIILGNYYTKRYIGFKPRNAMNLVGWDNFVSNMFSIYGGFLDLMGGISSVTKTNLMTVSGIILFLHFVFANALIIIIIYVIKKQVGRDIKGKNLIHYSLGIIATNLGIFLVTYTTYGSVIFESRYLLFPLFIATLLMPLAFQNFINNLYIKRFLISSLFTCILIFNISGNALYFKYDNPGDKAVPKAIAEYDVKLVYGMMDYIATRSFRILDDTRIYKVPVISEFGNTSFHHWGDYKCFDEVGEYQGSTLLIATSEQFESIPAPIRSKYKWCEDVEENKSWKIYKSDSNYFDEYSGLPENGMVINFPWTNEIRRGDNVEITDEGVDTNGKEGYALFGPYGNVKKGMYDFTLYYTADGMNGNETLGVFDVCVNNGKDVVASAPIVSGQNKVTLKNVVFDDQSSDWEHRVYALKEARIGIEKIIITKVEN